MAGKLCASLKFANVVSMLALFAARGGGECAAVSLAVRDGPIHGCVERKTGLVRVVRPGAKCSHGTRRLVWHQRGRRGGRGARGQNGTNGTDGRPGARGPSDAYHPT